MQRRLTRTLLGMEHLSYEERLERPGLFSLDWGKLTGATIEVNKIMRGNFSQHQR